MRDLIERQELKKKITAANCDGCACDNDMCPICFVNDVLKTIDGMEAYRGGGLCGTEQN